MLQKPHQFQLQLSFNFPNSVPTCPGNISVFLFGCLSLLSPPILFLFAFEISQEFPVQSHWPPAIPAQHPEHQDGLFCRFEEAVLEDQATSMGLSALQGRLPGDSAHQFLKQAEVHMLEILRDYYISCLSHFPQVLNQPSHDSATKSSQNSSSLLRSSRSSFHQST